MDSAQERQNQTHDVQEMRLGKKVVHHTHSVCNSHMWGKGDGYLLILPVEEEQYLKLGLFHG